MDADKTEPLWKTKPNPALVEFLREKLGLTVTANYAARKIQKILSSPS